MLNELSKIGEQPKKGITRKGLSIEERDAHRLAANYMKDAGLSVRVDEAGNTIGRWGGKDKPTLIVGSHLDTVPNGGAFDGAVGVASGIACASAIISSNIDLPYALEVIAFTDEEGAHLSGTFGSRAMMGRLTEKETMEKIDGSLNPLAISMEKVGLNFSLLPKAKRDPKDFIAYLELHIEQGPILERIKKPIGVVTGIPFMYRYYITIKGRADHSGTTPISMRDDALRKSVLFIEKFYHILSTNEGKIIGNIGNIKIDPGSFNVVPKKAIMSFELRSIDQNYLKEIENRLLKDILFKIDPKSKMDNISQKNGALMDKRIMNIIISSCKELGYGYHIMPSGAGHDATSFAPYIPVGMIFIPSIGGKSHSADEFTPPEAIEVGAKTLLYTILNLKNDSSLLKKGKIN